MDMWRSCTRYIGVQVPISTITIPTVPIPTYVMLFPQLQIVVGISVVTVIEIGTETAVFQQNRIEPKPRFYASLLAVSKTEQL